jgi:hypothetical protein
VGVFFQGREEGNGETARVRADALLMGYSAKNVPKLAREWLEASPRSGRASSSVHGGVAITPPQSGKNRIKITVGPDGLENVIWNDRPVNSNWKPGRDGKGRAGAEGSFGIYVADAAATIYSARLFIHSQRGENR